MSQPLFGCTVAKAFQGDAEARTTLVHRLRQPRFTFMGCKHEPRCAFPDEPTMKAFCESFSKSNPREAGKLESILNGLGK